VFVSKIKNKRKMKKMTITPERIEAWKKEFGEDNVKKFVIPLDNDGKKTTEGYFHKPTLKAISISSKFAQTDPIRSGQLLYSECFLGSEDENFENNEEVTMSCIQLLNGWFKVRVGSIKNA
jgi:hypothetical protein